MSYFQKHLKTISNENIPNRSSKQRREDPKPQKPRAQHVQPSQNVLSAMGLGAVMGHGNIVGQDA